LKITNLESLPAFHTEIPCPAMLRDVIGKARQVYFSSGKDGIRWNRTGLPLGNSAR
jgi:hypothetical protein